MSNIKSILPIPLPNHIKEAMGWYAESLENERQIQLIASQEAAEIARFWKLFPAYLIALFASAAGAVVGIFAGKPELIWLALGFAVLFGYWMCREPARAMRLRRIKESLSNRTYADRESVLPDQSIKILWVLGLRATSFNEVFRIVAEDPTHIPTPFEVRRLQKYRADVIDELAELERFTLFLKNPVSNPDPATLVTDRLREYVQATEKDILGKYLLRFINPN